MMKLIEEIEGFLAGQFNTVRSLVSLVGLEAKLAGLSIFPLLINVCMLFAVFFSFWFSVMFLLGYLIAIPLGTLLAIIIIVLINLCLLLVLIKYLAFNLKNMSFVKTRAYFSKQENEHEQLEKKTNC